MAACPSTLRPVGARTFLLVADAEKCERRRGSLSAAPDRTSGGALVGDAASQAGSPTSQLNGCSGKHQHARPLERMDLHDEIRAQPDSIVFVVCLFEFDRNDPDPITVRSGHLTHMDPA